MTTNTPVGKHSPPQTAYAYRTVLTTLAGLADDIQRNSRDNDRRAGDPHATLRALSDAGVLSTSVPADYGGLQISHSQTISLLKEISRLDAAIGLSVLSHFGIIEVLRTAPSDLLKTEVYSDIVGGARCGNAVVDQPRFPATTAVRNAGSDMWTINGSKYYASGAIGSDWIQVTAEVKDPTPRQAIVFLRTSTDGVSLILDDWDSFGHRGTLSGTVHLVDVAVSDAFVIDPGPDSGPPGPWILGAFAQALHAAVDLGTVEAAFDEAVEYIRTAANPRAEFDFEDVANEPIVKFNIGRLAAKLSALDATLHAAGIKIDTAATNLTDTTTASASIAVASAKTLIQDEGLSIITSILEYGGASSTSETLALDRHWRNLRTHSLHDPSRAKYVAIGDFYLNGKNPPRNFPI